MNKIKEDFVLYIQNYNIDGLNETNNLLLNKGSILINQYTQEYRIYMSYIYG
jgi:hypothetical protein